MAFTNSEFFILDDDQSTTLGGTSVGSTNETLQSVTQRGATTDQPVVFQNAVTVGNGDSATALLKLDSLSDCRVVGNIGVPLSFWQSVNELARFSADGTTFTMLGDIESDAVYAGGVAVSNTDAMVVLDDTSQSLPDGIFGLMSSGGSFNLIRNTAVAGDLSTFTIPFTVDVNDNARFNDDLTVAGDLTVLGTQFIADVETVLIKDNLLVINNGESGSGVTANIAGIEVDRGTSTDYQFVFQESSGFFKVGESGSLQAVATRDDVITDGYVMTWDATNNKLLGVDPSTISTLTPTLDEVTTAGSSTSNSITVGATTVNGLLKTLEGTNGNVSAQFQSGAVSGKIAISNDANYSIEGGNWYGSLRLNSPTVVRSMTDFQVLGALSAEATTVSSLTNEGLLKFTSTSYSDNTSELGYRIKFADLGGVANDTGIGLESDRIMWFNTASTGFFKFVDGTNGEVLRISNIGITAFRATTVSSLTSNGNVQVNGDLDVTGVLTTPNLQITDLQGGGDQIVGADNNGEFITITVGSGLSFSGGVLSATGGSSGSVTTSNTATAGRIAKFTSSSNIEQSIMTESGTTISVSGGVTADIVTVDGSILDDNGSNLVIRSKSSRGIDLQVNGLGTSIVTIDTSGDTTFSGDVTASSFIKSGGTSSQFLKADGSIDSSSYLTGNQTITLSGDISGSGTTSITTTIQSDAVEASMLNDNVISGQTALTSGLVSTDELMVSDAGVIKRMDISVIQAYMQSSLTFPAVNDATITISPSAGLSGGGAFTLNQASNETITISHDTFTARSISASGAQVLSTFTSNAQGHVTGITTRSLTLTDLGYVVPTLDQVTTQGDSTSNSIEVGGITNNGALSVIGTSSFGQTLVDTVANFISTDNVVAVNFQDSNGTAPIRYSGSADTFTLDANTTITGVITGDGTGISNIQDSALSSNVALKNVDNSFVAQTFAGITNNGALSVVGTSTFGQTLVDTVATFESLDSVVAINLQDSNGTGAIRYSGSADTFTLDANVSVTGTISGNGSGITNLDYNNISNPPTIPTVNNNTITITAGANLTGGGDFNLNQSTDKNITLNMATGGIGSGTYGSTSDGTKIDQITVDSYGRITAITTGATGAITNVIAGTNLNGGGTSGAVTVNLDTTLTGMTSGSFSGNLTASSLIKSGGTSKQFLMADGSTTDVGTNGGTEFLFNQQSATALRTSSAMSLTQGEVYYLEVSFWVETETFGSVQLFLGRNSSVNINELLPERSGVFVADNNFNPNERRLYTFKARITADRTSSSYYLWVVGIAPSGSGNDILPKASLDAASPQSPFINQNRSYAILTQL